MGRSEVTGSSPIRRISRHGLVYGVGIVVGKLIGLVMLPLYLHRLRPDDFGRLQLVEMTIEVVSIVAGSRLAVGIFHFYHKATTQQDRHSVLSTTLGILLITYGVIGGALYLLAVPLSRGLFDGDGYVTLFRLAAGRMVVESLILVPSAWLLVEERSGASVIAGTAKAILQHGCNVIFVVGLNQGAAGMLRGSLIANVIFGVVLATLMLREVGFRFSPSVARDTIRFGLPFLATQAATFISTFGDRYFLKRSADLATVGVYGVAYQFGFLLASAAYQPFNAIWEPMRFEVAKGPNRDAIFARAFIYFNLVLLSGALGLSLFVKDALPYLASPDYQSAATIVPWVVLAYVLQSWTGFHNLGLFIAERSGRITSANWIGAIVALAGYVLLIPPLKGVGAAIATVLSFGVREIIIYRSSQAVWPVRYEWTPVVRLVAIAFGAFGLSLLIAPKGPLLAFGSHVALFFLYLAGTWAWVLSNDDRNNLAAMARSPRVAFAAIRGTSATNL